MKKLTTVILILLAASAAVADTDLDPEDFLYLTPFNRTFYPELDYRMNPAVLTDIEKRYSWETLCLRQFITPRQKQESTTA
jgi:hypothetical protein